MNAPAKVLLKTASILFILGGVLLIVLSIVFGFLGNAAASSGAAVGTVIGALFILITLAAVLAGVIMLVIGILGVPNKRCNDPGKAGFYIVTGIILCILILGYIFLSLSLGGSWWESVVAIILPILYIVGGFMNRKAAAAPGK